MSQCTQGIAPVMFEKNHIPQDTEVAALLGSRVSVTKCLEPSIGVWFLRFQATGHFSRSVVFPSSGCSICGEITGLKLRPGRQVADGCCRSQVRKSSRCQYGCPAPIHISCQVVSLLFTCCGTDRSGQRVWTACRSYTFEAVTGRSHGVQSSRFQPDPRSTCVSCLCSFSPLMIVCDVSRYGPHWYYILFRSSRGTCRFSR